jgi:hypothetical protein
MKTNQKGFANVLIVIVALVVLGVVGYFIAVKNSGPSTNSQQQNNGEIGTILSFSIEPSTNKQSWIMYRDGAKAILKGKNIKSAEVRFYPTGTGITESSSAGKMQKISGSVDGDTWEVKLPTLILATNFWAEAEGLDGQKIKSTDLGNVGYEEGKQTPLVSQNLPPTCTDQQEGTPVITSLSSYSGSVGTKLEIKGCNFAGFEGDKNAWIEDSKGVKGILYGETGSTNKLLKVTLKSSLCQEDTSYSGLTCPTFLTLTPGTYKIYTIPWGKKSNEAAFTIK